MRYKTEWTVIPLEEQENEILSLSKNGVDAWDNPGYFQPTRWESRWKRLFRIKSLFIKKKMGRSL
jgi:hypothetical protein